MIAFGKAAQKITALVHSKTVQHDVTLFVGALIATGVFATKTPLSWDALAAAVIVAGRRVAVAVLAGK